MKVKDKKSHYVGSAHLNSLSFHSPLRDYSLQFFNTLLEKEGWQSITIGDFKKDHDWWKEPKMKVVAWK